MTPKIAVAIVHAAHIPERVPLYERLRDQLFADWADSQDFLDVYDGTHLETTRGKHYVWLPPILDWAAERQRATHLLTLQDDQTVSPKFWSQLRAMVEGRPDEVICLHNGHPSARRVFVEGKPGYHTFDGMVGQGHIEPIGVVSEFRRWRLSEVRTGMLQQITEDMLFGMFCMARRLSIFHPVPTLIDHDLTVPSTNEGFDDHLYRKPQVTWKELDRLPHPADAELTLSDPVWWGQPVEHIGRFYDDAHQLLPLVLADKKLGEELAVEYEAIETPARDRRFFMRARATR